MGMSVLLDPEPAIDCLLQAAIDLGGTGNLDDLLLYSVDGREQRLAISEKLGLPGANQRGRLCHGAVRRRPGGRSGSVVGRRFALGPRLAVTSRRARMGASKLKVTGINHVVLHVADLDRSRTFYMEVLGFDDRGTVPGMRASFLRCGMQGLDLFERADCDVHGGEEMNHMALNVDAADVESLVAGLSEAGIDDFETTPRNSLFIADPDGHRIEMLPISASERDHERQSRGR
jgi:catechol 2,3-dioxygenase-like lactoylglutathione lyase family enzyme